MSRRSLVTLALLAGSVLAHAQSQAVFRTETNYVEVDAVVTDADGNFVPGLTAADFQVSEQRRPQGIASFTYIDMPVGPNAVSTTPSPVRFRPDLLQRERIDADRIYLLYLNSSSTLARHRAIEFVRDYLQPQDIAAIWDTFDGAQTLIFTNNKAALLKDLNRAVTGEPRDLSYGERGQQQGQKLRDAVDWMSALQGRRKSLILFTEGWTSGLSDIDRSKRERYVTDWLQGRRRGLSTVGGSWLNPTDITDKSDVHIYTYDVRGLVAPIPGSGLLPRTAYETKADQISAPYRAEAESASALRSLADQTGGRAFVESNDYPLGFRRIVEDNSRYYILGYYSPNMKRDGIFRSLAVKVTRPGLTVRARDGYVAR